MGCCESMMRVILGSGSMGSSGDSGSGSVEFGGAASSSKPFTIHDNFRGSHVSVNASNGKVSGTGLALGCAPVEQDSAYWEATVTALPPGGTISLGVSRAPSPEDDKEALLGRSTLGDGEKTWGFSTTDGGTAGTLKEGDVIGIALDFTDLPMLFFSRGGAPFGQGDELAVMRIRGTVYPAVGVAGGAAVSVAFAAASLAHHPPRKCQALVVGLDMI